MRPQNEVGTNRVLRFCASCTSHLFVFRWVTCIAYTPQGHIVSGAMDSKVCLWKVGSTRCFYLLGHSGSVSKVHPLNDMVASSSYDKTIRLWTITKGAQVACLKGHKAPILEMEASETSGSIATGKRRFPAGSNTNKIHVGKIVSHLVSESG